MVLCACSEHATPVARAQASNPSANAIKMLTLGDSITQGNAEHQSYRYPLWKKLQRLGVEVDFIGSLRENYSGNPQWPTYQGKVFDADHEGHWGWTVDEILSEMDTWLTQYSPDIVLLHLGSNDVFKEQALAQTINELQSLILRLRLSNKNVAILMARVIPSRYKNKLLRQLSEQIELLAKRMHSTHSPIIVVDQAKGFNVMQDSYDGVHPNAAGEEKMAQQWIDAMQNHQLLK
jgi:lysophospholipase L1-like esterase